MHDMHITEEKVISVDWDMHTTKEKVMSVDHPVDRLGRQN